MRYRDIFEAPLADFGVHGSPTEPGSFQADDLKAMANPKWRAKLAHVFSKTPYDFNIYALNGADGKHKFSGKTWTDTLHLGIPNYRDYGGVHSPEKFQKIFGFLPPNYENAISVLFTFNEGSGRLPFTQWLIAHRLLHAISDLDKTTAKARIFDVINDIMFYVENLMEDIDPDTFMLAFANSPKDRMINVAKLVGKTQALRTGNMSGPGEIYPEFGAQYIVTGKVTLRRIILPEKDRGQQERVDMRIARFEKELNQAFELLFENAVGKIFVL